MRIAVNQLTHIYPGNITALDSVSATIEQGESVAVVGENGAGKTTFARHLNGLLKPTSGEVFIGEFNTRTTTVAQLSRHVGYVFQNPDDQLFERTVEAEVGFGLHNLKFDKSETKTRIARVVASVGLTDYLQTHPYDLQRSQRRLVALAATLVMDTTILVLDEPTMGQDVQGKAILGHTVTEALKRGRTVLTITHDLDFAAQYFERMLVMSQGRILLEGATTKVLRHADLLYEAGVEPPQLVRLAARLGLDSAPRSPEEFVNNWHQRNQGS